jgi:hypothetical protein
MPVAAQCRAHPETPAEASCTRCGDFMCRLCGPLSPLPLCARCGARGAVDWEERGEQSGLRAFFATFREAVIAPRALGARLSGAGRVGTAFWYAVACTLLGALPLSLSVAALLMTVADPLVLGLRSTGVLSNAVSAVLFAVALATLLPAALVGWASWVFAVARLLRVPARFDLLVRAGIYGFSPVAVPLLGPLLAPLAFVCALLCMQSLLAEQAGSLRATGVMVAALLLALGPLAALLV